jgi:acetyl-CoA carboxylase carboxyl transferase subunit beta
MAANGRRLNWDEMQKLGFIAYPDGHPILASAIEGAVELSRGGRVTLKPWKAMKIVGFKIDDQVRSNIAAAAILIADVTYLNMNVLYEMGYAVGLGKPIILVINQAVEAAVQRANNLGLRLFARYRGREIPMSWLTNFVRPKIRSLLGHKDMPDNLWQQCPSCQQNTFRPDLETNLKVCPHCGHHLQATANDRLVWTFDDGAFTMIETPKVPPDPLRFRGQKHYSDQLKEARDKTKLEEAILVAHGLVSGQKAIVAAMDFRFVGGSMGTAVGEAIVAAARLAVLQAAPLVIYITSGGARMREGCFSLMQMPRTVIATQMVKEAGLPFIVVLTDNTWGSVTASIAMLGDVQIAEPGALIGFTGPRVIEQTTRETLPEGFQRAEYLYEHGIVDMIVSRLELREKLIRIMRLLANRRPVSELAA